ncbi:MAG: DUF6713 family protein [Pseudomonadota bacterium]
MLDFIYFCMLGFFLTHELDAVKRHEWRVLPLTSFLPDHLGEQVFIWAHVPIIAILFYFGGLDPRSTTALGLSGFAIVHVFLHILFRNHPDYEFNNLSSWLLIIGTGVFGALHLIVYGQIG